MALLTDDQILAEYEPKIRALLEKVKTALSKAGYVPDSTIDDFTDEEFTFVLCAGPQPRKPDAKQGPNDFCIFVIIVERAVHDGIEDGEVDGINFECKIIGHGGLVLGVIAPYNYSEECWVRKDRPRKIKQRWAEFVSLATPEAIVNQLAYRD